MRKYLLAIVGLVLLCLLAALGTASGAPSTFTVNTTDDTDDSTCDASHCSLREAISAANSDPGSTIEFSIPATDTGHEVSGITGTWTISLASLLPTLTGGGTIISGTSQGNLNPDRPEIEISGASMGYVSCLVIQSADNVIHGLVINRCPLHGVAIFLTSATTNTVSGNYIGTDASGSTDLGNGVVGVWISDGAQGNLVGGDIPEERNVISGNDEYGVHITNDADWNTVSANYIGTDVTGTQDKGNGYDGVTIDADAKNNTIGPDNLIALNSSDGVEVRGTNTLSNTITRNSIHSNGLLGIDNIDGGNTELPPPAISGPSCVAITGTAPPSATVEIFTGPDEEGKTYLATCSADGAGNWSVTGPFTLDAYVTATATDPSGNTSEFSTAGACYRVFVPLTVKNY